MRLFTAIDLPPDLRTRLSTLQEQLRPLAKLQWSAPEKLHITTTFIGEWPEARLTELENALAQVSSEPVPIAVRGIHWMNRRVLVAGIEAPPTLSALAGSTVISLRKLGFLPEDREYHPHLTLARRKHSRPEPQLDLALSTLRHHDFGTFEASRFALFLSQGGKYTQLKEYSFSK